MLTKIQNEVFRYLTDFISSYGIPIEFRYSEAVDLLESYRKSIDLRAFNKNPPEWLSEIYPKDNKKYTTTLGVFNRTPLTRSEYYGNNNQINTVCKSEGSEVEIELHEMFIGHIGFSVRILTDSHDISDTLELVYATGLANRDRALSIDFDLGNGIEISDCGYNLNFSSLDDVSNINLSDLRQLGFSIELEGPFFIPFYRNGNPLLNEIIVNTHLFNKDTLPSPSNSDPSPTNIDSSRVDYTNTIKNISTFTKTEGRFPKTKDELY